MTTIDIHHGSETDSEHTQQGADAAAEEAKRLVAKARFDAFSLMTEARKEAEAVLAEARDEAARVLDEAEFKAESIVDAARLEAGEIPAAHTDPNTRAALEAEHDALTERVSTLRALAEQLEDRFDTLTANADRAVEEQESSAHDHGSDVHAPSAAPVLDYSPNKEAQRSPDLSEHEGSEKGSFYNRRSAKLPRIGEEGGRSALDMMRTIRSASEDS